MHITAFCPSTLPEVAFTPLHPPAAGSHPCPRGGPATATASRSGSR
jgi:hypothetical protein